MKTIAIICGGKSPEHEISVRSAKNILGAIRREKFNILLIGIDPQGRWRLLQEEQLGKFVPSEGPQLALIPGNERGQIIRLDTQEAIEQPEAIFLILHGPMGEDGTIQGLLRVLDLPFVGPDVLGSAVAMDKDVTKRILQQAGIKVASGIVIHAHELDRIDYQGIIDQFGLPLFVKPANMGSSVGVHKVKNIDQFRAAVTDAFQYDHKLLVEKMIVGREVECAVLGNEYPQASTVGEVVTSEEYSFEAKYESETAAKIHIPAAVTGEELAKLRDVALRTYRALDCEVLSRVDMFLTATGEVYVNEVNTLPGFTSISMYPKLWEKDGLSYPDLIEKLLDLAIDRFRKEKKLKTNWRD